MDFNYTEEQQLLKDSLDKFLAKNYSFETRRGIINTRLGMSPVAWEAFASMGLLGLPIPAEHRTWVGYAEAVVVLDPPALRDAVLARLRAAVALTALPVAGGRRG